MKLLINQHATINAKDMQGETPLHKAAESRRPHAVKWLIQKKANVNALDKNGKTPLDLILSFKSRVIKGKGTIDRRFTETIAHLQAATKKQGQ